MGSIGRYIFRTTMGAFLMVLVSLTTLIWMTQALREIDLMTNQGQTLLVFIGITGLVVPLLILIIAPLSLMIAIAYVLNKLSTDSELIVMNAAGMSPLRLFRAFAPVVAIVTILVVVTSAYIAPKGLRELRNWLTQVRADLVGFIAQPGRFTSLERGLTFHVRERSTNGLLLGLLVDDQRDPKERSTIVAEQGEIVKNDKGTFLLLQNGNIQRKQPNQQDTAIVVFDRYAFDLSRFSSGGGTINYNSRERYLWDLMWPDPNDPVYKQQSAQFRNEMIDRLIAPLYPIVFSIIVFAFLGTPRTTRQSREFSIGMTIATISVVRIVGLSCSVLGPKIPLAQAGQAGIIIVAGTLGMRAIMRSSVIEPPAFVTDATAAINRLLLRRPVTS